VVPQSGLSVLGVMDACEIVMMSKNLV